MEKEDKIIESLLNEKFIEKAPDGFTDRVMQSIEVSESLNPKQSVSYDWLYGLGFVSSIILAIGIISFMDNSFVSRFYFLFAGYLSGFFSQLATLFGQTSLPGSSILSGNMMLIGIFSIMAVLLLFDGFVLRKKRYMNLFVWTF
jgi:hypothetical protein